MYVKKVTWRDNPFWNATMEADRVRYQNEYPDDYPHIYEGEPFARSGWKIFMDRKVVKEAMGRIYPEIEYDYAPKILTLDPARFGNDNSDFFLRQGLMSWSIKTITKADNMTLASHLIALIQEHNPDGIFVDNGQGVGVIDRCHQLGYTDVIGIDFAGAAIDPQYANRRIEMYGNAYEWLKMGGALPNIYALEEELCNHEYSYTPPEQKILEPKEKVKEKIGRSPDKADAFVMTFAIPVEKKDELYKFRGQLQENKEYDPLNTDDDSDPFKDLG